MLVVHAGNRLDGPERDRPRFPATRVAAIEARLRALLATLRPSALVSSPAAGADLIALAEAQRLDIPVVILQPQPRDEFVATSVIDCGTRWLERFDAVVERARRDPRSLVVETDLSGDPDWYLAANGLLLTMAHERAGDEAVLAVTVRPIGGEDPPSVTDDFARRAERCGLVVLTIDPRPDAAGVTVGR